MFSFRAAIFFILVSSNRAYSFYDEFSSESYASPRADICLSSGTQCSEDCSAVLFCTGAGATPIVSINCTLSSQYCSFDATTIVAQCSNDSDCRPDLRIPIQCREAGNFPDPYDCRNSYTCESNNPDPVDQCKCLPGEVWAGPSAQCSTDNVTVEIICQDLVQSINCDNGNIGGNLGGIPIRYGYYYICERGSGNPTISLHKCPDGQLWNEQTFRCENIPSVLLDQYNEVMTLEEKLVRALPVCESNLTTTTTDSTNSTDTTTTLPTPTPPVCSSSGQIIPISGDCQQYWVCDPNLQPVLRSCENGTYLDCSWNGCYCVVGNCTNPPLVSDCSSVGQIIQIDCQSYWVCDANLDVELRSCENDTHLDCSDGCYCLVGPCPNPPVQLWIYYDDE